MPVAKFQMPDGRIARFEVPEGTTPEQAQALIEQQLRQAPIVDPGTSDVPSDPLADPVQAARREPDSFADNVLDVAGEFAAGANRAVVGTADIIPKGINAALRLAGSDTQLPTLEGALNPYGLQGNFMDEGNTRTAVRMTGAALPVAASAVPVARNVLSPGGAAAEFLGVGSAKLPAGAATTQDAVDLVHNMGYRENARKMTDSAGRVAKDKVARDNIWQGVDDGVVAMVKDSTPKTRQQYAEMLDIVEKSKAHKGYAGTNRPLQVLGKSIADRVKVVYQVRREAGRQLGRIVNKQLKETTVDFTPAGESFRKDLADMGINFDPSNKSNPVSFVGSDIDQLKTAEQAILKTVRRMLNTGTDDAGKITAYDGHKLKKYIDDIVDYGKRNPSQGTLTRDTESVLKSLRANVDEILDTSFPEYDRVNKTLSETIEAIDSLQDLAGKRVELEGDTASKQIGILTRKIVTNYNTAQPINDAMQNLDKVAKKYSTGRGKALVPYREGIKRAGVKIPDFSDEFVYQVQFADELDRLFGTNAGGSMLGIAQRAGDTIMRGQQGLVEEGARWAFKKLGRQNEQNALKAMRDLVSR